MKQVLFFAAICLLATCGTNESAKVQSAQTSNTGEQKDTIVYPYTASYSSQFVPGDPQHVKVILDLFKDWDENKLDQSRQRFADSVTIFTADGPVLRGPADSVIAASKPHRDSLGEISTTVHAWMPLRATDKNENWVSVWYTEYRLSNGVKTDSTEFQETWRLNRDGKADMLLQYSRKNRPTGN